RDHRRISKPRSANSAPRRRVAALSEADTSSNHTFLLRQGQRVKEGLHRGFAEAPAALMRSPLVVLDEPSIEIDLQLVDRPVDILVEGHPVELVPQPHQDQEPADQWHLRALPTGDRLTGSN